MTDTLMQMMLIMFMGAVWRVFSPVGLTAEQTRKALTSVVYFLFLPALILEVLWSAKLSWQSLEYTVLGVSSILLTIIIIWTVTRLCKFDKPKTGAVILATSFPNVTYLGLPMLEQTYGSWARSVAIQIDLFATAPVLFTIGIAIAKYYGEDNEPYQAKLAFLNTPPFWSAFIAVMLNINHIPAPLWISGVLNQLSSAVVPLMLFSLGLALSWKVIKINKIPYIIPVVVIKLALMPLLAMLLVNYLTLDAQHKSASVMEMAMPSMVIGIVFCDRFKLDSGLYAMSVTITTLISMITLPYWYQVL